MMPLLERVPLFAAMALLSVSFDIRAAGLTVIGAIPLDDRGRLGHVGTALGFSIPTIRRAVIHLAAAIDPHLTGATAGRYDDGGRLGLSR